MVNTILPVRSSDFVHSLRKKVGRFFDLLSTSSLQMFEEFNACWTQNCLK